MTDTEYDVTARRDGRSESRWPAADDRNVVLSISHPSSVLMYSGFQSVCNDGALRPLVRCQRQRPRTCNGTYDEDQCEPLISLLTGQLCCYRLPLRLSLRGLEITTPVRPGPVEARVACHVECLSIIVTEGTVSRFSARERVRFENATVRCKDVHHRTGTALILPAVTS